MKKIKIVLIISLLFASSILFAETNTTSDNVLLSTYIVKSEKSKANGSFSSSGAGLYYDSEALKIKLEHTSDYTKFGGVKKFNPQSSNWYVKTGLTYLNEKMYAYDYSTARVNQYGASIGLGYKLTNTLYLELAGNYTKLYGSKIGSWFEIKDETTKRAYAEIVKRFVGDFGTVDTSVNIGQTYYEFTKDETFIGGGINYYPTRYSKVSIFHNNEDKNHYSEYTLSYKSFELAYSDLNDEAYKVTGGIKFQCKNILDLSTCKTPTNIIPDISENDKFEQVTFSSAMEIQTSLPNPIGFQCRKPSIITNPNILNPNYDAFIPNGIIESLSEEEIAAMQKTGMLGSISTDKNGCEIMPSEWMDYNYQYSGSDMFFGLTGNPDGLMFQDFDWYSN